LIVIDHPAWVALQQGLANAVTNNLPEWIIFGGAVAIASVCMMPKNRPKSIDDWWTWFRDTLQTAVPAARAQREHSLTETVTPTTSTKQEVITGTTDPSQVPTKEG